MKIVGIGDLLIPEQYIKEGFQPFAEAGHEVVTIQWPLKDYEELQNINLRVETEGSESYEPPQEILDAVKDADIIITQFCTMTKRLIDYCDHLKAIGVLRGGIENVNEAYAKEKGIKVYNTPGRNACAVADFAVGMMICESRNIAKAHSNLKEGKWVRDYTNKDTVPDFQRKTVGIVGLGKIGQLVAQRMKGFDMKILAYDPYAKSAPDYVQLVSLEELLKESDFVTLHSRMTEETHHLINKERLALMKKTAYLINTARSGLVDEEALYEALKNYQICGAAIDVFDEEPPGKDYPLVTLDNVTITPHLAGGTVDAFTNSPILLCEIMQKDF
ncbi:MAG: 2-hydroxyacid dehydrogenase [Lachnospiraceae bacterium]|jgi:D-3-phosphoglycerate dehydrogenase|nr:2-hydroxyacid dehydrogenase [Lachnospiraceae bacterium]